MAAHPSNGFFVVWDDYRTSLDSADIYGGRISSEGQLLDGDKGKAIANGDHDESRPSVVASQEGAAWIVARAENAVVMLASASFGVRSQVVSKLLSAAKRPVVFGALELPMVGSS